MHFAYFSYLYFSIAVIALIAFIDVFLKLKNALDLKLFFLVLTSSIGIVGFISSLDNDEYFYLPAALKYISALSLMNVFSSLYFPKFKKLTFISSIAMLSILLFFISVNKKIIPSNPFIENFRVIYVDNLGNVSFSPAMKFLRLFFVLFVVTHFIYFWYVINKKLDLNNIYFEKIRSWTTLLLILSITAIIGNFALVIFPDRSFWVNSLAIFNAFFILLIVLKRPTFINRSAKKIAFGHKFNIEFEADIDELVFLHEFQELKYFTNKDASLEGLAQLLKVSTPHLSQFIQKKYNMSFSDLVNKNRVNYFFEIVQNPIYQNYTIDALAREVGFSSRQHLNKPFKKFHGGNPSDLFDATILPE